MDFGPQVYIIIALVVTYPILVIIGIRMLRRNSQTEGSERRQRPGLRRALNILVPIPFIALIAYMLWDAGVFEGLDLGFDPKFYYMSAGIVAYSLMLMAVVRLIRRFSRKNSHQLGENRRQRPWLRAFLNVLAALPVLFILIMVALNIFK